MGRVRGQTVRAEVTGLPSGASGRAERSTVAVRFLAAGQNAGAEEQRKFLREFSAYCATPRHENLVPLLAACVPRLAFVLPWADYGNLHDVLNGPDSRGPLQGFQLMMGVACGLGAIHDHNLVHRDVRSAHVFLFPDGDGGTIAKLGGCGWVTSNQLCNRQHDVEGGDELELVCQRQYVDPLYVLSGEYSEASDIFSLGVVLLEVLLGRSAASPQEQAANLGQAPGPAAQLAASALPATGRHAAQARARARSGFQWLKERTAGRRNPLTPRNAPPPPRQGLSAAAAPSGGGGQRRQRREEEEELFWRKFEARLPRGLEAGTEAAGEAAAALIQQLRPRPDWCWESVCVVAALATDMLIVEEERGAGGPTYATSRPTAAAVIESLEVACALHTGEQGQHLRPARKCLVCMDEDANTQFQPCGHSALCQACAAPFLVHRSPCPICRRPVTKYNVGHFDATYCG